MRLLCLLISLLGSPPLFAKSIPLITTRSENQHTKALNLNLKNKWEPKPALLLAKNISTFDPFIDYGEFQDDVTEEESINFFQHGRSLSVAFMGGYEALTLNIRQIYGDSAFVGANVSFFLDLRFAFQLGGVFPTRHYNSLYNSTFSFSHYGLDLKYYWNRQYLSKDKEFFSPYIIFGPFWMNIKSSLPKKPEKAVIPLRENPTETNPVVPPNTPLSPLERQAIASFDSVGVKLGFGFELALIKQSFIGVEVSYLYTVLQHENEDLSPLKENLPPLPDYNSSQNLFQRLQFPHRPEIKGYRFYGDLINLTLLLGVNF